MRRVHVGPIIIIYIDFDFQFLLSMKIMDYLMVNNPRKRKWEARKLGS